MQIFVRSSAKLLALNIDKDDTVQDIYVRFHFSCGLLYINKIFQEQVAQEAGCAKDDIVLSVRGVPLNDEQTLEDFDLVPGTTIDTIVKVLGGKTHGNLGKAGWVKKNTPKVCRLLRKRQ